MEHVFVFYAPDLRRTSNTNQCRGDNERFWTFPANAAYLSAPQRPTRTPRPHVWPGVPFGLCGPPPPCHFATRQLALVGPGTGLWEVQDLECFPPILNAAA